MYIFDNKKSDRLEISVSCVTESSSCPIELVVPLETIEFYSTYFAMLWQDFELV